MNLLFVHDTKFKEDTKGNLYTGGSYNTEVWNRYLSICDKLSVIATKEVNIYEEGIAKNRFNYFDKERIDFIETTSSRDSVKNFFSIKGRNYTKAIIKELVRKNDYIICRLPSQNGNIAIKYAKKYGKPYLVEVVGCTWDSLWNYNLKGKVLALPSTLAMKKSVYQAKYSIYVTSAFLQKRYPSKGRSVSCSDVSLLNIENSILEKRLEKIKNHTGKLVIGTTAAIDVKYKGQQYIIKAIGELKKRGFTDFKYQLAGGGDSSYLEHLAERYNVRDQVEFLGSLTHKEVFDWLDRIDLYVQPSKQEGLPRALIEAMSRGLPSFGAKTGGIPELLTSEVIFSNSISKTDEICKILIEYTKEKMQSHAKRNFLESIKYEKNRIQERRNNFINEFISNK